MEITRIKSFLDKYRQPVTCIRIILIYWVFLAVATHSMVFDYGITKGKFNMFIALMVMFYRILAITFVPGMLVLWVLTNLNILSQRRKP